jgi:hypothetical protein
VRAARVTLALLLTTATLAPAAESWPDEGVVPRRYIQVALWEPGLVYTLPGAAGYQAFTYGSFLKAGFRTGRLYFGVALVDDIGFPDVDWTDFESPPYGGTFFPLLAGYQFFTLPRRTACAWGMVPDLRAEAAFGFLGHGYRPYGRVSAIADLDYWGIGCGLEVGAVSVDMSGYPPEYNDPPRLTALYAGFRLRFLVLNFGLGEPEH